MTRTIDGPTGEIIDRPLLPAPSTGTRYLDPYLTEDDQWEARPDWMATISAGRLVKKGDKSYPEVSRDGTIYVHGDPEKCAGLVEALKRNDDKMLRIAFPYDEPGALIQQRLVLYSASELQISGNDQEMVEYSERGRVVHPAGTTKYRELRAKCKAETRLLFVLSDWLTVGEEVRCQSAMPDGLGFYSLRFTGRHSLHSIVNKLREVQHLTGGRLAGLPFDLYLRYMDVARPNGKRTNIPVWTLAFKPPQVITLTSGNMRSVLSMALAEGEKLKLLPAPMGEPEWEPLFDDETDVPEAAVERIQSGDVAADARYWERVFFAAVKGSDLATEGGWRSWLNSYTDGAYDHLSEFLDDADEDAAAEMVAAAGQEAVRQRDLALPIDTKRTLAIRQRAEALHFDEQGLQDWIRERFDVANLGKITRGQADDVLEEFEERLRQQHTPEPSIEGETEEPAQPETTYVPPKQPAEWGCAEPSCQSDPLAPEAIIEYRGRRWTGSQLWLVTHRGAGRPLCVLHWLEYAEARGLDPTTGEQLQGSFA